RPRIHGGTRRASTSATSTRRHSPLAAKGRSWRGLSSARRSACLARCLPLVAPAAITTTLPIARTVPVASAGRALRVEHWGDALGQGEVAGRCAAGEHVQWEAVPGFWSTIGNHTLKYAAWGDGFDLSRFEQHAGGAFTVWYGRDEEIVGVLAH